MKINIYKIGDCDWVAAENKKDAVDCHFKTTDSDSEDYKHENISEITEEQLNNLIFVDDPDDLSKNRTFKEELDRMIASGEKFPHFFATSEW